jgi:archaellum component FlaC
MSENVGSIVYEVDANTSGLIAAEKQVEAANKKMEAGFEKVDKSSKKVTISLDKTGKKVKKVKDEFNQADVSVKDFRAEIEKVKESTGGVNSKLKDTSVAVAEVNRRMMSTDKSAKPLVRSLDSAAVGGKKFGFQMRQASMQLSQVAQQGSVTGNYLQALAIQLPDLALGFGTVGIIVGALAGTIGIGLLNALTGADDTIDKLEETLTELGTTFETVAGESNQLAKSLRELQSVSQAAVELRIAVQTKDAEDAIDKMSGFITEAIVDGITTNTFIPIFGLEKIIEMGASAAGALEGVAREAKITTSEMAALAEAASNAKFEKSIESYDELAAVVLSLKNKYGTSNEAVNEFSKELSEQIPVAINAINTLKKLKSAADALKGGGEGFTIQPDNTDNEGDNMAKVFAKRQEAAKATIEQFRDQFQDEQTLAEEQLTERLSAIDDAQISVAEKDQAEYEARALHAQKLADIDAKRTGDEQAEAAKRLTLKKMELSAYSQLGGQLSSMIAAAGAENTAIGKAVFLANQALAVAGIIVNTQAAAGAALAQGGPIAGPALAANITALGYTSAAIAAGVGVAQTFSGRQTGGPTEANSTYRVNEAGGEGFQFKSGGREFIQTLGGNGKVIPANEMNQGGGAPQVNVIVNNNTSSNVSVQQEQDGNNVTIQMLVADISEGGPVSRALASSHNVKRKTS